MRKMIMAAAALLMCDTVLADTYYLQANKSRDDNDPIQSVWWTAPTGGVNMTNVTGAVFEGNRFDLNGFQYLTKNDNNTYSFGGEMVSASGALHIYSKGFNLAGLDWSAVGSRGGSQISLRKSNVALNITDMKVANTLLIRVNNTEENLALHATSLTGDGTISFGTDNNMTDDGNSIWGLDIDNSAFTGTIELNVGNLRFDDTLALNNATLSVNAGSQLTTVILDNNATFGAMIYDGGSVANGDYTAAQLNTLLSTDRFSGAGTLTVIPEPAALGLIGAASVGILFTRRIFII